MKERKLYSVSIKCYILNIQENMKIGCVKEIKTSEMRVGLTPQSVKAYINQGHTVYVEAGLGLGSDFIDSEYEKAGAIVLSTAKEVWDIVDMMVKVKEPLESEYQYFREDLIIYTYLHLAADEKLTKALLDSKTTAIAYETIELDNRELPCLKPMSEVAGRLSAVEGSKFLQKPMGGRGILISGVPGTKRANVVIIGAGVVGVNALQLLSGLNAHVTILDVDLNKLTQLDQVYGNQIQTLYSNETNIHGALKTADLVISAVLIKGSKAPKLVRKEYYKDMRKGAVIVDVAIDQGGSTEVSRATTHKDPIFVVDGIIHYCVANMPGAVPNTSTEALNNATIKYGLMLANKGFVEAIKFDKALFKGVNTYKGLIVYQGVAKAFDLPYTDLNQLL